MEKRSGYLCDVQEETTENVERERKRERLGYWRDRQSEKQSTTLLGLLRRLSNVIMRKYNVFALCTGIIIIIIIWFCSRTFTSHAEVEVRPPDVTSASASKPLSVTIVTDFHMDGHWMSQHYSFIQAGKDKKAEVVLIGDSIVKRMIQSSLWKEKFEPLHCLNFGIDGDKTQHVLWRILNGEFDFVKPEVIVLLVGTNNKEDSAEQVVEGIMACAKAIQDKQPASHIIVLGLLPRGEKPNALREKNHAVNKRLAKEIEGRAMIFLLVDDKEFVSADGTIDSQLMPDFLHFTNAGYRKLCEPLLGALHDLLRN